MHAAKVSFGPPQKDQLNTNQNKSENKTEVHLDLKCYSR